MKGTMIIDIASNQNNSVVNVKAKLKKRANTRRIRIYVARILPTGAAPIAAANASAALTQRTSDFAGVCCSN